MPPAGAGPRQRGRYDATAPPCACSCPSGLPPIILSMDAPTEQNKSTSNAAANSRKTMLSTVV